jgi:hypothetical protein
VGTFTVGYSTSPASDFTATMDWGDGTTDTAAVSQPGGAGTPYVVEDTHVYGTPPALPTTYPTTLTVTDTLLSSNMGSASSTATVSEQPVTLSPETFGPQVVGTAFNGAVATFTSDDPTTTTASFTASIDWGAEAGGIEQVSDGTVTQPGGPGTAYTVSGSNTYEVSGDFTVTVSVTVGGVTSTLTEPIHVDAAQVTVPCTGSCSGQVVTPEETSTAETPSSTGTIFVALADGAQLCPGGNFDYAPQITTVDTTGVPSTNTIKLRVAFLRENLQGPYDAPIAVCFQSSAPFVQKDGTTTTPVLIDGVTQYVGLLPACMPTRIKKLGPCLGHVSEPLPGWKTVVEDIKFPAGDPKNH